MRAGGEQRSVGLGGGGWARAGRLGARPGKLAGRLPAARRPASVGAGRLRGLGESKDGSADGSCGKVVQWKANTRVRCRVDVACSLKSPVGQRVKHASVHPESFGLFFKANKSRLFVCLNVIW